MQRRASGGEARESQPARDRREDRRALARIAADRRGGDRGPRLHQSQARARGARTAAAIAPRAARECAPGEREGQARHRRLRRTEHRQADACRTSALLHHRRLASAAVPRQRLVGHERRASRRLGPADGAAHRRARGAAARPSVFRSGRSQSVSEKVARLDGRSRGDVSGRSRGLQSRSEAARSSTPRDRRAASGQARLSRAVAAFPRCLRRRAQARVRQPGCRVRRVERRIRCRSADPSR